MPKAEELQLASQSEDSTALAHHSAPSPISILEKAINSGITAENISVVKELIQMCREQSAEDAKAAFAKAFFQLRKNMPEIHADKEARNKAGEVTFVYCSEEEIAKKLEPHLMAYGFAMLFGQSANDGRITVSVTLMHEAGHSEIREFTVRSGTPNAMKDGAMCDAGGATTAWRHLMQKMFGLKSRITDGKDPHVEGEFIPEDKRQHLAERLIELGGETVNAWFWETAGVGIGQYERITEGSYPILSRLIEKKMKTKGIS